MTKKDTVSVLETLQKNAARKGGSRIKNRKYTIQVPENVEEVRLAPQAITVVGVLLELAPEASEQQIFNKLDEAAEKFEGSKQTPWKIFQYYKKPITEAGFLTEKIGE